MNPGDALAEILGMTREAMEDADLYDRINANVALGALDAGAVTVEQLRAEVRSSVIRVAAAQVADRIGIDAEEFARLLEQTMNQMDEGVRAEYYDPYPMDEAWSSSKAAAYERDAEYALPGGRNY